jgi:hypothetical protein
MGLVRGTASRTPSALQRSASSAMASGIDAEMVGIREL